MGSGVMSMAKWHFKRYSKLRTALGKAISVPDYYDEHSPDENIQIPLFAFAFAYVTMNAET